MMPVASGLLPLFVGPLVFLLGTLLLVTLVLVVLWLLGAVGAGPPAVS